MFAVLLVLLVVLFGGGFAVSPGYQPVYFGGGLGTIIVILLILYLFGVIR